MKKINSFGAIFFLLLFCLSKKNYGQTKNTYIDSIDQYVNYIDSFLYDSRMNFDDTDIIHSWTHFSGISASGKPKPWCGSAELTLNSKNKNLYKLEYSTNCSRIHEEQTYYFRNNKIVFLEVALYKKTVKRIKQYYLNDVMINPAKGKLYINEGYEMLKSLNN